MRETLPSISRNQLRETPTYAHLISCCLTDGRSVSILRQNPDRQKARKQGLPGLTASGLYMKIALSQAKVLIILKNGLYFYPRGKIPDSCTSWQREREKGGVKLVDIILRQTRLICDSGFPVCRSGYFLNTSQLWEKGQGIPMISTG